MNEREYKYKLDIEEYTALISKITTEIGLMSYKLQVNYYYDTKDFLLNKDKITLRVRQIDSNLSLELKTELHNDGLLKINEELAEPISSLPITIDFKKHPWKKHLPYDESINLKGSLITERRTVKPFEGIKFDVDKNIYMGKVDYELEVEFDEGLDEKAFELLKYYVGNVDGRATTGKRSRYFEELIRLSKKNH